MGILDNNKTPLVVYDIDDIVWLLNYRIAEDLGIDEDRFLSTFSVKDNPIR